MTFDHTIWEDIAIVLANTYGPKAYFTPETLARENPLDPVVVMSTVTDFFGSKPLNLVIIGRPMAWSVSGDVWVENWPPTGFEEAKAKHILTFPEFALYETHIWTDFIFVNQIMAENPDSRIQEMMDAVDGHMQDLGNEMSAYGITYHGKINDVVEASFFYDIIDTFLAKHTD